MSSPSEDQDRERWRGRVEAFMETHTSRVNAAFEMLEVMRERLDDKVDRIEQKRL